MVLFTGDCHDWEHPDAPKVTLAVDDDGYVTVLYDDDEPKEN